MRAMAYRFLGATTTNGFLHFRQIKCKTLHIHMHNTHENRNAPTLRIGYDKKVNRTFKTNGKEEYIKVIRR